MGRRLQERGGAVLGRYAADDPDEDDNEPAPHPPDEPPPAPVQEPGRPPEVDDPKPRTPQRVR